MIEREGAGRDVVSGYTAQEADFLAGRKGGKVVEKYKTSGKRGAAHGFSTMGGLTSQVLSVYFMIGISYCCYWRAKPGT